MYQLFRHLSDCNLTGLIYRDNRSNPDEIEGIVYLTRECTECELAIAIVRALSDISDISDRFAIQVGELSEIKECLRMTEVTNLSNNIRESGVYICFIEFSFECKYLDTCIGRGLIDGELREHMERWIRF